MNISPFPKCVCPSCFEEIYIGECAIVSTVTADLVLRSEMRGNPIARRFVERLDGPKYTQQLAQRRCTNASCRYLLPPNIERVGTITLAVVGDNASGKSHYIAALIHQIKEDWAGSTGGFIRFECLTPEVERTYTNNYFNPLFLGGRPIPFTQPANKPVADPLIYNLTIAPANGQKTETANLAIYDASGEDFRRKERVVEFARFVLHTNAFIFVVNPVSIPSLFMKFPQLLQGKLQTQYQNVAGMRAGDRFNEIISTYERFKKYKSGSELPDTPVAIMLSKSDLLQSFSPPGSYTFMNTVTYGDSVDLADLAQVDLEVQTLLRQYKQGDLLAASSRLKHKRFFATSATGEPPDANDRFAKVEPLRCLDPILWILSEYNIMKNA